MMIFKDMQQTELKFVNFNLNLTEQKILIA